jgi:phage N-6-adenine-methyltransferase
MNKNSLKTVFSHKTDEWETSQDFFDRLNLEYNFTLDPAATSSNAKCSKFYTKEDDGLVQSWTGESLFVNPPYSQIYSWMKRAAEERWRAESIVLLLPVRTDTKWFHEFAFMASKIVFIKGRLKFGGSQNSAPFPSMLLIFSKKLLFQTKIGTMENK